MLSLCVNDENEVGGWRHPTRAPGCERRGQGRGVQAQPSPCWLAPIIQGRGVWAKPCCCSTQSFHETLACWNPNFSHSAHTIVSRASVALHTTTSIQQTNKWATQCNYFHNLRWSEPTALSSPLHPSPWGGRWEGEKKRMLTQSIVRVLALPERPLWRASWVHLILLMLQIRV